MKSLKKSFPVFLALALLFVLTVSFTTDVNETPQSDQMLLTNSDMIMDGNGDNRCCPPNWTRVFIFNNDPAIKWDNNGDNLVCFKGAWLGDDTPKGKGNDPLFTQSNVKDNNNPCED